MKQKDNVNMFLIRISYASTDLYLFSVYTKKDIFMTSIWEMFKIIKNMLCWYFALFSSTWWHKGLYRLKFFNCRFAVCIESSFCSHLYDLLSRKKVYHTWIWHFYITLAFLGIMNFRKNGFPYFPATPAGPSLQSWWVLTDR